MTKNDMKTTLNAVISTLDTEVTVNGVRNMTAIVGCCQAVRNVINSLDELPGEQPDNKPDSEG